MTSPSEVSEPKIFFAPRSSQKLTVSLDSGAVDVGFALTVLSLMTILGAGIGGMAQADKISQDRSIKRFMGGEDTYNKVWSDWCKKTGKCPKGAPVWKDMGGER